MSGFGVRRALLYGAGNVGAGLVFAFANATLPLYLAAYGLPNALIGLLAQDRPPWAGLLQPVVGWLSDRTRTRLGRRRPYIVLGVPITAAALLLLALRPPLPVVVILLVALTTSLAVAYGPYQALLADLVPPRQRGRVGSVLGVGNMLGQIGSLWLAAQLWPRQEAVLFLLLAVGLAMAFALTVVGVPEPAVAPRPAEEPAPMRPRPLAYARDVLEHREVVKYLAAILLFWMGTGGVVPFLTRFGVNELGTDESTAFQLLMVAILASGATALPAGWLGDRLGKKPVLFGGLVLLGVAILASAQVQTVEQAIVALAVTGAANGAAVVLLVPLLADLVPRVRAGEFLGLGGAAWELGQPVGAVLAGLVADSTGTLRGAFIAAGLLTLVSAALLLPVRVPPADSLADQPS